MRKLLIIILLLGAMSACKTTEANYRAAYEKAIAGRDSADAIENTIYGRERRQVGFSYVVAPDGDTVAVKKQLVRVTEGGGGIRENLKPYCVVVGQFKQKFNAVSMRDRVAVEQGSMPGAFVVETGEPYYYVVGASFGSLADATACLKKYSDEKILPFRSPLPFILQATASIRR